MKRAATLLLFLAFVLFSVGVLGDVVFDISAFNEEDFDIEFDEMDDTGEIKPKEGGAFFGAAEGDDGLLMGTIDVKIIEGLPPVIRLSFFYMGEEWCFIDRMIIKVGDTRYTFEVDRSTEVNGGKIYEGFTIALTDQTISLIENLRDNSGLAKYRMDGSKRDIDGSIVFSVDALQKMYDAYVASGALFNNFSVLYSLFPVTIK